jgi:hypothetical protein
MGIVVDLTRSCVNWGFLARVGRFKTRVKRAFLRPTSARKAQLTYERIEYNVFFFDEPLKGFKLLKILKISLTFRFDRW